ncbi:MAG: hypothetical protein ACOY3I_08860 [Verrucomicrobiota bacterium]
MKKEEVEYLLRSSPAAHFEACVRILDKENNVIVPRCNVLQERMAQVYETCMRRKIPCRMMVLKPRQVGCSTFAAQILYHHCRNYRTRAVQIADDMGNSDNIFRIFCRHAELDAFPWKSKFSQTRAEGKFSNGSLVEKDTAQNPRAGISATRQAIHASEVAKWAVSGVKSAQEVMGAMLNSLADVPRSAAIVESTPQGAAGWFYEHWQDAATLKDFFEGKKGNGWIKVFAAWFEFDEHQENNHSFLEVEKNLSERERRGIALYHWTPAQIAWRRRIQKEKCGDSERIFDEYYPEDDVSCFLVSGSPRFDVESVAQLELLARQCCPDEGVLHEAPHGGVTFEPTPSDEAWAQFWERPREGCRYLITADLSLGVDQSQSGDADRHSVLLLRENYRDDHDIEFPTMLVARIKPPTRVAFDVLAWQTDLLSRYYGRCLVAPEMNNSGMAFIERLKEREVPIYCRQRLSASGRKTSLEGWQTTAASRKLIIDELAAVIRDGLDIRCSHLVRELKTFATNSDGKEEALPGCHDDDVLALAIGLHCLPSGTIYEKKSIALHIPSDGYEFPLDPPVKGKW